MTDGQGNTEEPKNRPAEEQLKDGASDSEGRKRNQRRGRSRKKGAPELDTDSQDTDRENIKRRQIDKEQKDKKRRRFHPSRRQAAIAGGAAAAVLILGGIVYAGMGQKYKTVFFPGTEINGMDVSGKTAAEAREMIEEGIKGYVLTIREREGKTEQISREDINLHAEFDGSMDQIIAEQNPMAWGEYVFSPASYKIQTIMAYDDEAFQKAVEGLACFDETATEPVNAHLSEYTPESGYTIIPEVQGTKANYEVVEQGISEAILKLEQEISLEELGSYEDPEVTSEDETLKTLCDNMNKAAGVKITYQFGDQIETLTGDRIHQWLVKNRDGSVGVDSSSVAAYVKELADKYNTNNKAKILKTSYGKTVTIKGGTYGWKINQAGEADELSALIKAGESQSRREPVYSQKAASHGANDYGDTYVEINLTAQHLFFYKNGSLVVESDFVSGNLSKGWGTPAGTYPLTYKQKNAVLKGENYRTPVDYWMPFNGGIGMHDATWRSSFGGTIYKTSGSHGCINLPHGVAQKIYENISGGIPVLCYNLEGTEKASTPEKPKETEAATAPSEEASQPSEGVTEPSKESPAEPTTAPAQPSTEAPAKPETAPAENGPAGPSTDSENQGGATGPGA